MRLSTIPARIFVALVLTSVLASPAGAQVTEARQPVKAADQTAIQIDNFGRINDQYYRGAQPKGRDYADLATLGVKTVLNLTSDDADATEKAMAESAGLDYFQIPMTTRVPPTADELAQFLKIVNDRERQPVYVHCVGGKHRTGVMTAMYRMIQDSWTPDQAFKEMKLYKFGADFLHPEFKQFVFGAGAEFARAALAALPTPSASAPARAGGSQQ